MVRLIDTSIAIALGEVEGSTAERFAALDQSPILSVLSLVELEGGIVTTTVGKAERRRLLNWVVGTLEIIPYEASHAQIYAQIVSEIGFSRAKIIDRMIASQALNIGAVVATLNPRDFRGIPGLQVEDWSR